MIVSLVNITRPTSWYAPPPDTEKIGRNRALPNPAHDIWLDLYTTGTVISGPSHETYAWFGYYDDDGDDNKEDNEGNQDV